MQSSTNVRLLAARCTRHSSRVSAASMTGLVPFHCTGKAFRMSRLLLSTDCAGYLPDILTQLEASFSGKF